MNEIAFTQNELDNLETLREIQELEYELADRHFFEYFKSVWPIIEPDKDLNENWHQELIAEYLTACHLGQIKKLIINIPPRYLKSNLVTVTFPTWVWTKTPGERFMFASYASSLSNKHSNDRRAIITSEWYTKRWNNFTVKKDSTEEFTNDARGHFLATTMQGKATGLGGNYLIIDDPHDANRAHSDVIRQNDIDAFDVKFTSRLDNPETGVIIIIMQRLHDRDLSGHLLAQEKGYTHLKVPATCEKKNIITFPVSGKIKLRNVGDILHPSRHNSEQLEEKKIDMGSFNFAGQFQQNPAPREGGILKRAYWMRYNKVPLEFDSVMDSWDCTFKDLTTSDFVCGEVWGIIGVNKYLLHITKKKMGFIATLKAILKHREMFPQIRKTLVEDKANGSAVLEVMKQKITGMIPFEPGVLSKTERAIACEPQLESGNVYLPVKDLATFDVDDFIDLCAAFPNAAYDDVVDSMTQILIYLGGKKTNIIKAMGLI